MKKSVARNALNQNADSGAIQANKQNSKVTMQKKGQAQFSAEKNVRERGYSKQPDRGTNRGQY